MPNILDILAPYLSQMGGGGVMSPGQPTYGGDDPMSRGELPGEYGMPEIRSEPVEAAGVEGPYAGMPMGAPPAAPPQEASPNPLAGVDTWKAQLPGLIGTALSGIAGQAFGGHGLAAMSGFAQNFANTRHQQIQQKREQEFQTQKAVGDTAHKMWQELQGADLSKLPPQLSHLAQQKTEFDQKYAQAIVKDGISPKEAQELISIGSIIKSALPQVEKFRGLSEKAEPYTSAIAGGSFEPPPSAEGIADLGLPNDEAANLAGIDAFREAELSRQQYDTPQFDARTGGLITPREGVTLRGQEMASRRAEAQQASMEANRLRLDADRDRAFQAQQEHWNRMDQRRVDEDMRRQDRYENMPLQVLTVDENGQPVTKIIPRRQVLGDGAGLTVEKQRPLSDRRAISYMNETIRKIDELDELSNKRPGAAGGAFGWRGRVTEGKRALGAASDIEADLVRKSKAIVEEFARAKEGAVLPEQMLRRLEGMVPNIKSPTFKQDLQSFRVEAVRVREEIAGTETGRQGFGPPPTMSPAGRPTTAEEYLKKLQGQ